MGATRLRRSKTVPGLESSRTHHLRKTLEKTRGELRQHPCLHARHWGNWIMSLRLLALFVLTLSIVSCGGYSSPSSPSSSPAAAPSGATSVTIPGGASTLTTTAFGADPLTVAAGTTVSWVN